MEYIIQKLTDIGVDVYLHDRKLKARSEKGKITSEVAELIRQNKDELIEFLERQLDPRSQLNQPTIEPVSNPSNEYPLSFSQQRLWIINQLEGGSAQYNMAAALWVKGAFDTDIAQGSIENIIRRHQSLRTVFREKNAEPVQVIRSEFEFSIDCHDISHLEGSERDRHVERLVREHSEQVFDLAEDLLIRVAYVSIKGQVDEQQGLLLVNMHHIASDGWSVGIFIKEFVAGYRALLLKEAGRQQELKIQYKDFACWQRKNLSGEVLEKQLAYWEQQLEDIPVLHELPLDYPRPEKKSHVGDVVRGVLDTALSQRLQEVATKQGITAFMLLHGALSLLLSRHSGQHDIVIATPVANRLQKELEPLIGFFVNTLVLRVNTRHEKLDDFLRHVRQVNLGAQANQDIPFDHLVEHCHIPRSARHTPLFQIMFSMDTNEGSELSLPGLQFSAYEEENVVAKFDLNIRVEINDGAMAFYWEYDTSLFRRETVERLNNHLQRILMGLAEPAEGVRLRDLPMLSDKEIGDLLRISGDTRVSYPGALVHELFEAQVRRTPDNIAATFNGEEITYRQLNVSSNKLAHYLRQQGAGADTLVGICMNRSIAMLTGILAILKSGSGYVPFDPAYPQARQEYISRLTGIKCLITDSQVSADMDWPNTVRQIDLASEGYRTVLADQSSDNPARMASQTPDNLAYVMFTSGSTGEPKGVMIEHRSIASLVIDNNFVPLSPDTVMLQNAPIAFDATTFEIWGALLNGGRLVIQGKPLLDMACLGEFISANAINTCWMTSGLFDQFVALYDKPLPSLKYLLVGGDVVKPESVIRMMDRNGDLQMINGYGPTENTTFSCCYTIPKDIKSEKSIPIGKPLSDCQVLILDEDLNLVPQGASGELYVGGNGLARGYIGRADLTEKVFIRNPFSASEDRLYRVGDRVRMRADGNVEFIGRVDDQVKIRGYRIEPGEIEHQLTRHDQVAASLVAVHEDEAGDKRLVAYVLPEVVEDGAGLALSPTLETSLKQHLKMALPAYMVPSIYIRVDSWPLTANGKIDKRRLPVPEGIAEQGQQRVEPVTETERQIAVIWSRLLKREIEDVGVTQDFFEIGGHSLLAVRLISEIRAAFGINIPVENLFEKTTIRQISDFLDVATKIQKKNETLDNRSERESEKWII